MLTLTETFDDNLAEDLEKSFLSSCDLMIDTAEEPNEEEKKVNIAKKQGSNEKSKAIETKQALERRTRKERI